MKLFITDGIDDGRLDCVFVTVDQFNDIAYHPYIHTTKWNSVIVDLDSRIMRSYIKQVIADGVTVVPRLVKDEVGPNQLFLLREIYPDDAAEILSWSKLINKDQLDKVKELAEKWNWALEY